MLLELEKPRIIRRVTRSYGGGTPGITEAQAIAAVEAEATLDLTGDVTAPTGLDKTVSYIIRINGSYYEAINGTTGTVDYGGSGNAGGATGTDAAEVINAVIASLTNGGTVFLKQGTYHLVNKGTVVDGVATDYYAILVAVNNIRICGEGHNTILYVDDGEETDAILSQNGVTHLIVENLAINGNKANQSTRGSGIKLVANQYFIINNCYIHHCESSGIAMVTRGGSSTDTHGVITNNISTDNDEHGIHVYFTYHTNIKGNHLIDNINYGIHLNNGFYNSLVNNNCYSNTSTGIYITSSQRNKVVGNDCSNRNLNGIMVLSSSSHNTIIGNTCVDNRQQGIYLLGSGANKNTVTANTVARNLRFGVLLVDAEYNTITANIICENDIDDTASYDGIRLDTNSNENVVANNIIHGNDRDQIRVQGDYNIIENNNLDATGAVSNINNTGTGNRIRANYDWITENSGSDSIANGTTSRVVAHGLNVTPSLEHFTIIGGEDPTNDVGTIWIDTIGAANFTVNVENDPGASNWDFGWKVIVL